MAEEKQSLETTVAVILTKVQYIEEEVREIKKKLEANYVTKEEFDPIKKIIYGVVGVILLAFATAVVALVISK